MIIPAIDIRGGNCVRLYKGDFEQETIFPVDPVELAKKYQADGAQILHVVDLDAAKSGSLENRDVIRDLVEAVDMDVQVGGGVRDAASAAFLLAMGVHRVVIGSLAMKQPDVIVELLNRYGPSRVCVALDVRPNGTDYKLTAEGWLEDVPTKLETLLDFYVKYGIEHVLITDISRDGAMTGPNVGLYQSIVDEYPTIKLQASGGVRSVEDLRELKAAGAAAAIVGKALLVGAITMPAEFAC